MSVRSNLASPAADRLVPPILARWRGWMEQHPSRAALALGVLLGPLGLLCTSLAGILAQFFLPPESWGNSAAAGMGRMGLIGMLFAAVVFAPLFETLLGQVLPIETARRFGARPVLCVLLSALVFACGHYLNVGLIHGITTFFGGAIFACAYVPLRPAGIWPACIASSTAHALHNGLAILIMAFFKVS